MPLRCRPRTRDGRKEQAYLASPGGGRRLQSINHVQHRFGPQARQQVLRQVYPPNRPRLIHQKLSRTRDGVSLLASALMDHAVGSNRAGARIGQERERIALSLTKLSRFFRRIDTDRNDLCTTRDKFR
jgi:hypothetical protein